MVVCVECLPADKPWDVVSVSVIRRSSGVAPRACVRVYARVLVPPNLYIHTYDAARSCTRYSLPLHLSRFPANGILKPTDEGPSKWAAARDGSCTRRRRGCSVRRKTIRSRSPKTYVRSYASLMVVLF